jgi:hypothetical protein
VAVAQKERSQRGSVRIQTLNLAVCQPVLGFRLTYARNAKSQTEKPRPHKAPRGWGFSRPIAEMRRSWRAIS